MGSHSHAGIGRGRGGRVFYTTAVNSKVHGKPQNYYPSDSNYHLRCQNADPRVLTANCSIRTEFQDSGFSYNDACPKHGTIASTEAAASTAPTTPTTEPTLADTRVSTIATVSTTASALKDTTASTAPTTPTTEPTLADTRVSTDAKVSTTASASTEEAALAADTVSTGATASTAATAASITTGSLLALGGLGIVGYSTYQWITGYRNGLRGKELAKKPLTRGKELASAAVNSVSQCIQGTRERMNRQRVPTQKPDHEMSQVLTDRVTELDKRV
ncbi:hypothetical protein ACTL6P_02130 [Endozoicomonas acroporae]|nr:hypothetical protein [Endozoicomonas acroporae]